MKIKRLSIQGFKSFVDRVVLDFAAEPAAIIGPNGCGKSNVIDAIRWVTGEQNPRHLRGRQMEDVIFNGSEARKPVGMAEVVLTFSNERAKAPSRFAAFSEIEVARRLYRSGESEYYINRVRCRLRDVVDLFTDTGIGKEGYSIVEQGQVSWLVNARPEERRVLFEEAAGVNRFKHRRDTAIRRLEATKENLLRVSDIIAEVKRQLNSLNRQAKKAERYRAAKEALKDIDLRLSSMEYALILQKKSAKEKKIEEAGDEAIRLATEKSAAELRRDTALSELHGVEERYQAIGEKVSALEKELGAGEREVELSRIRGEELQRDIARLTSEIDDLSRKKDAAGAAIEETRSSLAGAAASTKEGEAALSRLKSELDEMLGELGGKTALEAEMKARLVQNRARLSDIRHALQSAIDEERREREREARCGAGMQEATEKIAALEDPLENLKRDMALSTEQGESLESEARGLREELAGLEEKRRGLISGVEGLKEARAAARARLNTLEEMERNLDNVHGGARAILKGGTLRGVHGIVADFIEANAGFERAVEAALAERLEYVIVEGQGEGLEAIGFLKSNSGGRGSFVPLKDLRPAPSAVPAGLAGRIGARPLVDEIKIRDGYGPMVKALMGETLLVNDMDEALALWRTDGMFSTIVTLEGERLNPEGVITGGGSGGPGGGILQRRGEIKGIKGEISGFEARLGELVAALSAIDNDIASARQGLERLAEDLHRVEIQRVNTEGETKRQETELKSLIQLQSDLAAGKEEARAALERLSEKKRALAAEREAIEGAIKGDEEGLGEVVTAIAAMEEKKSALSARVTASQVELARLTERRRALETRLGEQERLVEELGRALKARLDEKALAETGVEEKEKEAAEAEARLKGLYNGLVAAREERAREEGALASIRGRIKEVEEAISALDEKKRRLEEEQGALGFGLKELELRASNLEERLAERYGLGLKDLQPTKTPSSGDAAEERDGRGAVTGDAPDAGAPVDMASLREERDALQARILAMGEVSLSALEEYRELEGRHAFLLAQQEDLTKSTEGLMKAIARINRTSRARLRAAFDEINERFRENFPKFFRGGHAELRLTDETNILESGIDIVAQPPGKKLQNISLLSGGEKALTAVSLIFSIFLIKPSPFCLLDEVDAPLDEANIDRFNAFVRDISNISQFILITHNKRTMEVVDRLYGVTMEEPGVSKIVSVRF